MMSRKSFQDDWDKPYSKAQLKEISKVFAELRKAGSYPSVQRYVARVKEGLKARDQ